MRLRLIAPYFSEPNAAITNLEKRKINWLFLATAIIAEVIATSALRASDGFSKLWPSLIVVVGYGIAFLLLSLTLRTTPVGIAYAVWSGAGIVLVTLIAWLYFGQRPDPAAIIGMSLIVAGVIVLNAFSRMTPH